MHWNHGLDKTKVLKIILWKESWKVNDLHKNYSETTSSRAFMLKGIIVATTEMIKLLVEIYNV